jgi:hypothetical protein
MDGLDRIVILMLIKSSYFFNIVNICVCDTGKMILYRKARTETFVKFSKKNGYIHIISSILVIMLDLTKVPKRTGRIMN